MALIAKVEGLKVYFYDQGDRRFIRACEDVGFSMKEGTVLGVVGESGCGKTVTALSMMGLIDSEPGVIGGEFFFNPKDEDSDVLELALMKAGKKDIDYKREELLNLFHGLNMCVRFEQNPFTIIKDSEKWLRRSNKIMEHVRGKSLSMVFQNPRQILNPFVPVGLQLERTIKRFNKGKAKSEIRDRSMELLTSVRLFKPHVVMNMYPDSLSIGMSQRVVIAIALSSGPKLLIADEPTTGLDTTNKQRIIDLLASFIDQRNMSLILISHNIGIVKSIAHDVVVMYAGFVVERGSNNETISTKRMPKHPYTEALVSSVPTDADIKRGKKLSIIHGIVPNNKLEIKGCPFLNRCPFAVGKIRKKCRSRCPDLIEVTPGHFIRCYLYSN